MRKLLLFVAPTAAVLAVTLLPWLSDRVDVYTVQTETAADGTLVRTPRLVSATRLREQLQAPGPKVHVDSPIHDFGRADPLTVHEHVFVVRNVGDAPLELTEGPATCKCTLSRLAGHVVPPGDKTHVVLRWNTGRDEQYAHHATIYTNDPRNRAVRLSIKGTVQTLFRCAPEQLVFSRVVPGETPSATAVVYSQVWDEMELEPVQPTDNGVTCTIDEIDPGQKESLGASAGRRITVTLPPDLPEGYFNTPLVLRGRPRGGSAEQSADCELAVEGKVIRRLSVYGPEIDVQGTVDLGRIRQGNTAHVRLMLKLRDPERNLTVKRIETSPSFLRVSIEPHRTSDSAELGLYYLHIEVPKDAPTFHLPPTERGLIHVEFDHPRVAALDLPVDLVIMPLDGV